MGKWFYIIHKYSLMSPLGNQKQNVHNQSTIVIPHKWFGVLFAIMKHMRHYLLTLLVVLSGKLMAQAPPADYFQSPLDIPLLLSGTFGELRGNHFHAGIDIKTMGVEGKRVLAAADGYISRINVSTSGYGKAIYITHPNGFMTVYAHLQRFNEEIENYVRAAQHKQETFTLTLYPGANTLPVKQGQLIAVSGNTGGSGGPHLHFEIRDQGGERPINPLQFNFPISDQRAPKVFRAKIYEVDDDNRIFREIEMELAPHGNGIYKPVSGKRPNIHKRFAVGIQGYDHQDGSANKNGIYRVSVLHNNEPYYTFRADGIRFDQTRYINAFIDYPAKINEKKTFYQLYEPPNYNLDAHPQRNNRGIISVDQEEYTIEIEAADFHGNLTKVHIPVNIVDLSSQTGQSQKTIWNWDMANAISERGMAAYLPEASLYDHAEIEYQISDAENGCIAPVITIGDPAIAIHRNLLVSFDKSIIASGYNEKQMVVVRRTKGGKWHSIGADVNTATQLKSYSKTFGDFSVKVDSVAPTLHPINFFDGHKFSKGNQLTLHLSDDFSGIDSYRATINGRWILMEYEPKRNLLFYTFDNNFPPEKVVLAVSAWDNCGNKIEKTWTIERE